MSLLAGVDGASGQGVPVYRASDFIVTNGANLGDPAAHAAEMMLDDVYALSPTARRWRLALTATEGLAHLSVAEGGQVGHVGAALHLDCCATFMAPDGTIVDALILVELDPRDALIASTYVLPLAEIHARTDYALVSVERESARTRFAALATVSFTAGTHITLATGAQCRVEDLAVGDRVLTRDNGVQPVRWIGCQTVRATGAFAPILIRKGALNNAEDLTLSPNQRLFVYQRQDRLGAGAHEVMVKAELLINGDTVVKGEGGFVDYFQVLFDQHEFIFAEGIATESMIIDARTSPALPKDVRERIGIGARGRHRRTGAVELSEGVLDRARAAELLRRASTL